MHGNARINIAPIGNILMKISFANCNFFSCSEMWQGIAINASGATGNLLLSFGGCNIEDAFIGLQLDEINAGYSILGNSFRNNYIGISNLRQNGTVLNAMIGQNTFLQTALLVKGSLVPPFAMSSYPFSYAGIKYTQVTTTIGTKDLPNTFSCLTNGLVSLSSTISSINNTFQDIRNYGIRANDGTISATSCRFQLNGVYGISTIGSNLSAQFNTFNGAWLSGIESFYNMNAEQISIVENTFNIAQTSWKLGITVSRPQASLGDKCIISQNIFTIGANMEDMTCIEVSDFVDDTGENEISLNNIVFNSTEGNNKGIYLDMGHSNNFKIDNNTIYFGVISNYLQNGNWGISLINSGAQTLSTGSIVVRNTVTGIPANLAIGENALEVGFFVNNLKNLIFCENTVDQTFEGFHFRGVNDVEFRENYINHHSVGLSILDQIGIQFGRGNQWSLDINACINEAAIVWNGNPLKSQFIVPEGNTLPWLPPNAKLFPDPAVIGWFKEGVVPLDYCEQLLVAQPQKLTHDEKELVDGVSLLSGVALWDLKRDLYAKLLIFSELRPSGSPEEVYFYNLSGTTIAAFGQLTQQIRQALSISANDQVVIDGFRTGTWLKFADIAELDGSINYSNPDNLTNEWFAQRALLLLQVATNSGFEIAFESARNQQLNTTLQIALSNNANIVTTLPFESARKILNELRIRYLLGEPMTQALYQQALNLAQGNPATLGFATNEVLKFLANCDQSIYRSDIEINIEGDNNKTAQYTTGLPTLKVTPNPANINSEVSLLHIGGILSVYNLHGKRIKTQIVTPDMSTAILDLATDSNGLYWVVLTDQSGAIIGTAKVAVLH